ncbi:hypothetical protein PR003_g22752 [Phytophthora rubi]|uniref:RxLR effector protein n=1 Tax=Phytophthora rubi TaxID=129364 RepID=A0A6A3J8E8_9STRA|nr:hypothetical protein PR002_g22126 [Phytophthora rubi]KAE8990007.1 hypothetical protein PR001_g21615 [Phytophthora rubi]KAE9300417.1 hypothetical protein PR003_g22752 [Phytophthora rubi]
MVGHSTSATSLHAKLLCWLSAWPPLFAHCKSPWSAPRLGASESNDGKLPPQNAANDARA